MDVKKLVLKSVDFRYFLSKVLWAGIFMVIALFLAIAAVNDVATRMTAITCFILFISIILYCAIRIILLFACSKDSRLYTADVLEVHNKHFALLLRSRSYSYSFTLTIHKDDGSSFTAETSAVFKHTEFSSTYFGNYVNETLQVLYNPKNKTVIVVGTLDPEQST